MVPVTCRKIIMDCLLNQCSRLEAVLFVSEDENQME